MTIDFNTALENLRDIREALSVVELALQDAKKSTEQAMRAALSGDAAWADAANREAEDDRTAFHYVMARVRPQINEKMALFNSTPSEAFGPASGSQRAEVLQLYSGIMARVIRLNSISLDAP